MIFAQLTFKDELDADYARNVIQMAKVAVPRKLFQEILRLIDAL